MTSQDIRLRLVIRRYGVPEVKLLWPCTCSDDLTISRLLEQVNDIVTLESGEWGLEDYVVELFDGKGGSFECLHFQPVGRILKDEDQVLIRSLLTDDLKRRRLNGRHQISADGKHLVDGIAFGRPWLRTPRDRPPIELPPRKRARITFDDETEEEEEQQQQKLLLEAPTHLQDDNYHAEGEDHEFSFRPGDFAPSDEDDFETTEEEDDEDGELDELGYDDEDLTEEARTLERENTLLEQDPTAQMNHETHNDEDNESVQSDEEDEEDDEAELEQTNEDLEEEARLLREENEVIEEDPAVEPPSKHSGKLSKVPRLEFEDSDYVGLPNLDIIALLQATFPAISMGTLVDKVTDMRGDAGRVYLSLAATSKARVSFDEFMDAALMGLPQAPPEKVSLKTVINRSPVKSKRPLIEEVEAIQMPVANAIEPSPTKIAEIVPNTRDSSSGESDDDSSSDSSSDDDSESGSDEEDARDVLEKRAPGIVSLSNSNASDDDSESDKVGNGVRIESDDSSEGASSDSSDESSDGSESGSDSESDSESESDSGSESESESESEAEAKGASTNSKVQTAVRSSPKQQNMESLSSQQQGKTDATTPVTQAVDKSQVSPGCGLTRTQKRNARRRRNKQAQQSEPVPETVQDAAPDIFHDELLARKRALLAAIVEDSADKPQETQEEFAEDAQEPEEFGVRAPEESPHKRTQKEAPGAQEEPAKRRGHIDLGAGRRLLFGALGLKAPKTKADEEKIRQGLMKDVRPLENLRTVNKDTITDIGNTGSEMDLDTDSWRDKIVYRAVECCHDNMVLSEPPFPFVQRWDPQQKFDKMRKRKRNSDYYNGESSYVGDDSYYDDTAEVEVESGRKNKKKKKGKSVVVEEKTGQRDHGSGGDIVLNYDDTPMKSSQFTDLDDLPSLPDDSSTLPILEQGSIKPGMVITWKRLVMSKATKWQPELIPTTGLILPDSEEGKIQVLLAKRDRENNEKVYDEETGQRVYDKFEAPDMDEADDEEDDGFRALAWGDLIEPRLLQHEPTTDAMGTPMRTKGTARNEKPAEDGQAAVEVSDFQTPEEHLEEGLSTAQVRAAVEDDILQSAVAAEEERIQQSLLETQDNDESVSIQSGQPMPQLGISDSGDEVIISTTSDSEQVHMDKDGDISGTLEAQLDVMGGVEIVSPDKPSPRDLHKLIQEQDGAAADEEAELKACITEAFDSQSPLFELAGSDVDGPTSNNTAAAAYPELMVPSSQLSIGSGRQPQTDYDLDETPEDETVIPETLPQLRETAPVSNIAKTMDSPSNNSSSPFPSLEEIFMSATSSKNTQSPMTKAETSFAEQKPKPLRDMEYEEAMRRLDDDGHESDNSTSKNGCFGNLFPNSTQPEASIDFMKTESSAFLGESIKSEARQRENSPFCIPAGSQVIELSSSSSLSGGSEDEDQDVVRSRQSVLPKGPGWKRKFRGGASRGDRGYSSSEPSGGGISRINNFRQSGRNASLRR